MGEWGSSPMQSLNFTKLVRVLARGFAHELATGGTLRVRLASSDWHLNSVYTPCNIYLKQKNNPASCIYSMAAYGRDGDVVGNTKQPRLSQRKRWCFTWNNYPAQMVDAQIQTRLLPLCNRLVYQSEVGANGTPHIQGACELKTKMRYSEFNLPNTIHWESMRNDGAAFDYCLKADTHDGLHRFEYDSTNRLREVMARHMEGVTELRPWQTWVEALHNTIPDKRTIHWLWEPTGNCGKTWFAKYMCLKYPLTCISTCSARSADIVTIAHEDYTTYLFDFPRCNGDFTPYQALECLKNGMVSDGKLKKKMELKLFHCPHIICFANQPPDTSKLSADRWCIKKIDEVLWDDDEYHSE